MSKIRTDEMTVVPSAPMVPQSDITKGLKDILQKLKEIAKILAGRVVEKLKKCTSSQ